MFTLIALYYKGKYLYQETNIFYAPLKIQKNEKKKKVKTVIAYFQ